MADSKDEKPPRAHPDAELSAADLEVIVERLASKRAELSVRLVELEQEAVVRDDCSVTDAADAASNQEGRLRAAAMVARHHEQIQEIDAAFQRLEYGRYGISEETGEPIGIERLKLMPWARVSGAES